MSKAERSGKRNFGVKRTSTRERENSSAGAVSSSNKKFGVKTPSIKEMWGTSNKMGSCPENCPGEYVLGVWIHSKECRYASMLWRVHGKKKEDWNCPFECEPTELPHGWTHPWECPFWDWTGRTPIDHNAPKGTKRVRVKRKNTINNCIREEERNPSIWDEDDGLYDDGLPF